MAASQKHYKELRRVMDAHGFRLLDTTRDGREHWVGLRWTAAAPFTIRPGLHAHVAVNLIRQIAEAAGEQTVDALKKRHTGAIKTRAEQSRARDREAAERHDRELDALVADRDAPLVEGVTLTVSRSTLQQVGLQAEGARRPTAAERAARRDAARRDAELSQMARLMSERPVAR